MLPQMCTALHVTYPSFLSDFNQTLISVTFSKNIRIKFHENRRVVSELFHTDGRQIDGPTDMTKLFFAFRSCANAPKNVDYLRNEL